MGLFLLIVLIILGTFVGLGWLVGAAVQRRRQRRWAVQVPDPAAVYEEGRTAGFAAGYAAGRADALGVSHGPSGTATPTAEAPWSLGAPPRTDPARGGQNPDSSDRAHPASRLVEYQSPPDDWTRVPAQPDRPVLSREEAEAAKAARDIRNINIALYSASLLLVVAGGLFIGAAVPGGARAITISLVVALFYGSGLVLHARAPRLRPAAVAFAGTGLALLPVAGLLFGILTDQGRSAWFVTALIGTAAYVLAAVRLQSRVVAYLTLPFFLSVALSSVSLIGAALVWYLTCSIGVAAVLAVLVRLAPRWLPKIFTRALIDTHRLLTPLALGASLVLGDRLTSTDRALLWVVATAYYAVMMSLLDARRVLHFYALRLVGSIAALWVALAADLPVSWSIMVVTVCAALQVVGLTTAPRRVITLLATALRPDDPSGDASGTKEIGRRPAVSAARAYTTDLVLTFGVLTLLAASVALTGFRVQALTPLVGPDQLLPMLLVLLVGMMVATRHGGALEALVLPGVVLGLLTPWWDPWRTEIVLVITVAYLAGRSVRSSGLHRERFALGARAAVTALAPVVVLVHLPPSVDTSESRDELAGLALVTLLVLNQLTEVVRLLRDRAAAGEVQGERVRLVPGRSRGSDAGPAYGSEIVCCTSGASLLGSLILAGSVPGGLLVPAVAWICVIAGCFTSLVLPLTRVSRVPGVELRGDGPRRPSSRIAWAGVVEALGPVSLVTTAASLALLGSGLRSYEILLAIAVLHFALMMRRAGDRARRGAYLLAAQLSFTVLTAVLADDLDLSVHGAFVVVAVGIALQETVRVVLRIRLRDTGLQTPAAWFSVVLLGVFPFVYGAVVQEDAQLDVVTLHLILLAVISALLFRTQRWNGVLYPALYAVAALVAALGGALSTAPAGLLPVAPLTEQVAALVSLACGAALVTVRMRIGSIGSTGPADAVGTVGTVGAEDTVGLEGSRVPVLCGIVVFALEAVVFAFTDGAGWDRVVVAASVGAACFALADREKVPGLDVGGAIAVIVAATALVEEVTWNIGAPLGTGPMQLLLGAVLAAAVLFTVRSVTGSRPPDPRSVGRRGPILGAASLGWSAIAAVLAMGPDASAIAGSAVLAAAAVLAVREMQTSRRSLSGEFAFLVVVGAAQRIAVLQLEGIGFFWAAQWWVVAAALLAVHAFVRRGGLRGTAWLTAAASILSVTGLSTIVGGTTQTQIWSLGGFVALLAVGVVLSRRRFSLWGAIGIALALLWFLRGFTFLLLTVAALLLIAFAIWKLNGQARGPSGGSAVGPAGVREAAMETATETATAEMTAGMTARATAGPVAKETGSHHRYPIRPGRIPVPRRFAMPPSICHTRQVVQALPHAVRDITPVRIMPGAGVGFAAVDSPKHHHPHRFGRDQLVAYVRLGRHARARGSELRQGEEPGSVRIQSARGAPHMGRRT